MGETNISSLGHSLMEQNRTHSRASPDFVIWRIKNILQITYSKLEELNIILYCRAIRLMKFLLLYNGKNVCSDSSVLERLFHGLKLKSKHPSPILILLFDDAYM